MEGCATILELIGWCIALVLVIALIPVVLATIAALGLSAIEAGAAGLSLVVASCWPVLILALAGLAALKVGG